jgi:hypothetical protein
LRGKIEPPLAVGTGDSVILAENDSDDIKVTAQIPKEWQPMTANDSAE